MENKEIIMDKLYSIVREITELQMKLLEITDENSEERGNITEHIISETVSRIGEIYAKARELETIVGNSSKSV